MNEKEVTSPVVRQRRILVKRGLVLFFFAPDKNRKCAELRDEERKRHPACTTLHARREETLITAMTFTAILVFKNAGISACDNAQRV